MILKDVHILPSKAPREAVKKPRNCETIYYFKD